MPDDVRKGQAPSHLARSEFSVRFHNAFRDPAFEAESDALGRLEEIAWQAYSDGRKAPRTRKAGPGYADPDYDLSLDWIEAKARIDAARTIWADPASRSRVLVICGAARNDGTCPGEISKTFRLAQLVARKWKRRRWLPICSTSACSRPSTVATSIPARAAYRPRCRSATGRAAAIRTMR
jgi:hypothetical protein